MNEVYSWFQSVRIQHVLQAINVSEWIHVIPCPYRSLLWPLAYFYSSPTTDLNIYILSGLVPVPWLLAAGAIPLSNVELQLAVNESSPASCIQYNVLGSMSKKTLAIVKARIELDPMAKHIIPKRVFFVSCRHPNVLKRLRCIHVLKEADFDLCESTWSAEAHCSPMAL